MQTREKEKLAVFFAQLDEDGVSNAEKARTRAKVIRRVADTDKDKSYEDTEKALRSDMPGVVEENGRVIGLGIHIFNEDVYPLQSFEIYLRGCDLTGELDLSESRDMVFLDLYRNRLSGVRLGALPALRILGLQDNALAALDPRGLSACQGIDAGKNRLKEIDVTRNRELVELYVNDNRLRSIDLSGNPKLKYFYCHHNGLTTLDTTHNPLLRHLDATGNPLREIRSLAPRREEPLPLCLTAKEGGCVGLKYNPVYTPQWKETGLWEQQYCAYPDDGYCFAGWFDLRSEMVSAEENWIDEYGASRELTARFERTR